MSRPRRGVTVTLLKDGDLRASSYHVPFWLFRAATAGAVALAVLAVLAGAFYVPVARLAARVPGLRQDVARLEADNAKIRILAAALDSVEASYAQLRTMVGADIVPEPLSLATSAMVAPAIVVRPPASRRRFPQGRSAPRFWPLDERGYLTRGQVPGGQPDEQHPGIDVAVSVGTLVRASGGGVVVEAGEEAEYGRFVLLQHPGGYQSMYGHLSRVVVSPGQEVRAGAVIGRSGNTGRSSAPHLHFEVRRDGTTVDPMTLIREQQ